jgi:hypothetical protein
VVKLTIPQFVVDKPERLVAESRSNSIVEVGCPNAYATIGARGPAALKAILQADGALTAGTVRWFDLLRTCGAALVSYSKLQHGEEQQHFQRFIIRQRIWPLHQELLAHSLTVPMRLWGKLSGHRGWIDLPGQRSRQQPWPALDLARWGSALTAPGDI